MKKTGRSATKPAARRPGFKLTGSGETVTVPAIGAPELFARAIEALSIDRLNENLRGWDFFTDQHGRDLGYSGKTYDVAWWKKGKSGTMTGDELRDHFRELGYVGVVPALLVWLIEHQPREALYSTIPEQDAMCRWSNQQRSVVATLYHHRDAGGSRLFAITPPHKCSPGEVYLAFREL